MPLASERLFISREVIERLRTGQFKPVRSTQGDFRLNDRRDRLSPLALTKRAVRYEPYVFLNRSNLVLETAEALNHPINRIIQVYGQSGVGKTAFTRAVVELMGGTPAQLLWFDASEMTDDDAVIRFMIEYLIYVCQSQQQNVDLNDSLSPIEHLKQLLILTQHLPILLVIDNIEIFLNRDGQILSQALNEMFTFLLRFENIKLMLVGSVIPGSLLSKHHQSHVVIELEPLDEEAFEGWWQRQVRQFPELNQYALTSFSVFRGLPELAWAWVRILKHPQVSAELKEHLVASAERTEAIEPLLLETVRASLPLAACELMDMLSLVRHSLTPNAIRLLAQLCFGESIFDQLSENDSILLRILMKKVFPPQSVLVAVRSRLNLQNKSEINLDDSSIFEPYYQLTEAFSEQLQKDLEDSVRLGYHRRLTGFYVEEKNKPLYSRLHQTRTRYLVGEIQYHEQTAKRYQDYQQNKAFDPRKLIDNDLPEVSLFDVPTRPKTQGSKNDEVSLKKRITSELVPVDNEMMGFLQGNALAQGNPSLGKALLKKHVQEQMPMNAKSKSQPVDSEKIVFMPKQSSSSKAKESQVLPSNELNNEPLNDIEFFKDKPQGVEQNMQACLEEAESLLGQRQFKKADELYSLGLELKSKLSLEELTKIASLIASLYSGLAKSQQQQGDMVKSAFHYHHALKYFLPHQITEQANAYLQLGLIADQLKKNGKALQYYVTSLKLQRQVNNVPAQAGLLFNIGNIQLEKGQLHKGIETIRQSMVLDQACNHLMGVLKSAALLGEIYGDTQQFALATQMLQKAYAVSKELNNTQEQVFILIKLGQIYEACGEKEQAYKTYQDILGSHSHLPQQLSAWLNEKLNKKVG